MYEGGNERNEYDAELQACLLNKRASNDTPSPREATWVRKCISDGSSYDCRTKQMDSHWCPKQKHGR